MALYKHPKFLRLTIHEVFDVFTDPEQQAPYSGLYRCEGCGLEIAANQGNTMPSQNHHQHGSGQGAIRWQLIVAAGS